MSSDLKYWYLNNHKLFRNLSFGEINSLCILKRFNKSKRDQLIDLPHSEKERVYFLKKGVIKLIKIREDGQEELIDILQKGDMFGNLSMESEADMNEFFKVVSDEAIICTFYKEKLEEVMNKKPQFALNYIKFIGLNFKKMRNSYRNILFRDVKTRLVLLLDNIIKKEEPEGNSLTIPNYLIQKDIVQLICTTRQTVNSLLKELEDEGILTYQQKEIEVQNIQKLDELAKSVK